MFFSRKSKAIKAAKTNLILWAEGSLLLCRDMISDADKQILILQYFLGSATYVCNAYRISEKDLFKIHQGLMLSNGFTQDDMKKNYNRFLKDSPSKQELEYYNAGFNNFKKWLVDDESNSAILLAHLSHLLYS